jgi:cellulose synthase/poly-beta-1,6-N-acetylglucosamine synthase-like glycosyltransferase
MVPDMMLITAYLGINAIIWVAMYGIGRDRKGYEKPGSKSVPKEISNHELPTVSIVVPLYLEKPSSIMRTVTSVSRQSYPKDLLEVLLVVEESDSETLRGARAALKYLSKRGIKSSIYILRGRRSSKARALNSVLRFLRGEIIAVYDADDTFDENQVLNAVRLMISRNYGAIGMRVYRYSDNILGKLLYIDTVIWYDLILNTLKKTGLHVPLSGEGLYIWRKVLEKVGGFPEKLAEDAYLSLTLFEKGYRIGLLDSYVEEAAPMGITSHIKQRIRWYRGHLECLSRILLHSSDRRLRASLSYISPIVAVASLIMSIITMVSTSSYIARGDIHLNSQSYVQNGVEDPQGTLATNINVIMFAMIIAEGLIPIIVVILVVADHRGSRKAKYILPYIPILPLYWILISVAAILAIIYRKVEWYKTRRS